MSVTSPEPLQFCQQQTDQGSCGFCHAEMMSTGLMPTGCCSFTLSFTVLTEMLLGSAQSRCIKIGPDSCAQSYL